MNYLELWNIPEASGRDGIHISAQLRVDAGQLRQHGISWAATTMETAAMYVDKLEDALSRMPVPLEIELVKEFPTDFQPHNVHNANGDVVVASPVFVHDPTMPMTRLTVEKNGWRYRTFSPRLSEAGDSASFYVVFCRSKEKGPDEQSKERQEANRVSS